MCSASVTLNTDKSSVANRGDERRLVSRHGPIPFTEVPETEGYCGFQDYPLGSYQITVIGRIFQLYSDQLQSVIDV